MILTVKTLRLDFIKCIIPKSRTMKHCLTSLPDAYLATKIPDMSGKNLTYGNPTLVKNTLGKIMLASMWPLGILNFLSTKNLVLKSSWWTLCTIHIFLTKRVYSGRWGTVGLGPQSSFLICSKSWKRWTLKFPWWFSLIPAVVLKWIFPW